MRIIALMNQKGGVGKTTTTVNLGAALAEAGKKVLLIDLDPQSHLSINYGLEPSAEVVSLYHVLIEERSLLEAIHQAAPNIALIPSSIDLAAAEIELVSVLGREQILKKRLESAQPDFDYVLLDCPPSLGLLTLNALSVANEVIIPMQPHFLALQGVGKLLETVHLVSRRMNPGLKVAGIVLTMWDSQTKLSGEVVNDLNSFIETAKGKPLPWANARIFKSKIRRNIKLAESPSFGQTILAYDAASNGAADYRSLAKEILGMEGVAVAPGSVESSMVDRRAAPVPVPQPQSKAVEAATSNIEHRTANVEQPAVAAAVAKAVSPRTAAVETGTAKIEQRPANVEQAVPAPAAVKPVAPPKPKLATLVTPAQAAQLKAAKVPEVATPTTNH